MCRGRIQWWQSRTVFSSSCGKLNFLSCQRKNNFCWAFFTMDSMWLSRFRSWEIVVPRNLNDSTAVTGRFSICSCLFCTCVLVDLCNVISHRQSTVPIQSSHLAKYSSNPWMCSCPAPFIEDASRGDLCELEAARYPRMYTVGHRHHSLLLLM